MKLQNLAVIFAIIIVPVSIVLHSFIQSGLDTINLQTQYDTRLSNATYDALRAYQLNSINGTYSATANEKQRNVESSINTFFTTLGANFGASETGKEALQQYVPALVYTMYDGYYIYGPFTNQQTNNVEYGLKPYIYYTKRYTGTNYDITINYTLDNYISIYGTLNGKIINRSGYLINAQSSQVAYIVPNKEYTDINGVKVTIEAENLKEFLSFLTDDNNNITKPIEYRYIYAYEKNAAGKQQKLKLYYDEQTNNKLYSSDNNSYYSPSYSGAYSPWFYYKDYKKVYILNEDRQDYLIPTNTNRNII